MIASAEEFANTLNCAMKRRNVRAYVMARLELSLREIGISKDCITDITSLLQKIYRDPTLTGARLAKAVSKFRSDWEIYLNSAYLGRYESTRWKYVQDKILAKLALRKSNLGRCLDIGCGRGCVTESLVLNSYATSAWGIDPIDFSRHWKERQANSGIEARDLLKYKRVPLHEFGGWLAVSEEFDTVFLLYVLHHSTDYWGARTIREVKQNLSASGIIVVLEDSIVVDIEPEDDPHALTRMWRQWVISDKPYCLSIGFDVQVVLDFVAVHLLAGFSDVTMACNYKVGSEWDKMFHDLDLTMVDKFNLGFPEKRDIDVPQAVFVLKPNDSKGNRIG